MNIESILNKLEKQTNLSKVPERLPADYASPLIVVVNEGEDGKCKLEEAKRLYKKSNGLSIIVTP